MRSPSLRASMAVMDAGVAAWIYAAMLVLAVVPIALGLGIGRWLERQGIGAHLTTRRGMWLGGIVGCVLVFGTFFEGAFRWANVGLELPRGFDRDWVVLLDDPRADRAIGIGLLDRWTRLEVPAHGVLRLRNVDALDGLRLDVAVNGRDRNLAMARTVVVLEGRPHIAWMFEVGDGSGRDADLGYLEGDARGRRLLAIERGE